MNQAEIEAQKNAARIVRVTNPYDFEFTHAWGGVPYTLTPGKPVLFPLPLADHLAKHLVMQALIRKAPTRDANEVDGRGKDRPLWDDQKLEELKALCMKEIYTEESKPVLTEAQIMAAKIEELNRAFADLNEKVTGQPAPKAPEVKEPEPVVELETKEPTTKEPEVKEPETKQPDVITYKDKAEVIAELTKRGITFDARAKKADLEKLLEPAS